ncbi:L-aspartate oxidase [Fictibacillus terranigra]|uniref:L-aspartate oxidase n=1 Tax=Fictibacillus terranigra TaxID=3058424 RepID=A0ABT8E4B4_9BACL|nr:L-aspartate oxidase [Fictibacillus sp. CENA-BCM004]MDN4072745.1 L-aspartate oxidase [Fictibacillus sp. CENA-BCM004]
MNVESTDVLIIGSGIAGLMTAECLRSHKNVTIVTKSSFRSSNSYLAQGGIAAVTETEDHWAEHFMDTVTAGSFHNEETLSEILVKEGTEMIRQLEEWNVPFDRNKDGSLTLGREGGHRRSRIIHAGGDRTGSRIIDTLYKRIAGHVTMKEYEIAGDLIIKQGRCAGAWTKNSEGEITIYFASTIILACGGAAGLYSVHSNDRSISGDSIALAYRAGAVLSDLEFIQFHPTMLFKKGVSYGLVSEAVRGEGGRLVTSEGAPVMSGVHELGDLAPRDVVSRTIFGFIQKGEDIFLDVSKVKNFTNRFPSITSQCKKADVVLKEGKIPVAPGAHFTMGGTVTNQWGETTVPCLYAVGEASRTGVHGANRLASNSLLEGVVFAKRTASRILESKDHEVSIYPVEWGFPTQKQKKLPEKIEIQRQMTQYAGIVRTGKDLDKALRWFRRFSIDKPDYYSTPDEIERMNMLQTGWLIISSAQMRTESRGGHYRSDYPTKNDNDWLKKQIYRKKDWNEQAEAEKTAAGIFA